MIIQLSCVAENEKPEAKQKRLEAQFANLQIVSNVEKIGTAKVRSNFIVLIMAYDIIYCIYFAASNDSA